MLNHNNNNKNDEHKRRKDKNTENKENKTDAVLEIQDDSSKSEHKHGGCCH